MRWDELFADLEGQLAAQQVAERDAEVADRTRRELSELTVLDRARASRGAVVRLRVSGVGEITGVLTEVGAQWLLVGEDSGQEALVPLAAVLSANGFGARSATPGSAGPVFARLGLGTALRRLAQDRAVVTVWLRDGSTVSGTIDRVGADFVELSALGAGELPRRSELTGARTVPVAALAMVRRGA